MSDDIKPFDQLTVDQQKVAIDLVVACSLIVTRLPGISQAIFKVVEAEFASQYDVPVNIGRYAMRALGRTMFDTPWQCTVTKDAENNLGTQFRQNLIGANGNEH